MTARLLSALFGMACIATSFAAAADVAVIVHPSYGVATATPDDLSKLFLGKTDALPGGDRLVPLDQAEGSAARNSFYKQVANKNAAQLNAYWSRLIFTGQGQPPKAVESDAVVLDLVAKNPSLVGYINASQVNTSVKVVATFPD
ncbi:MAG TPA: phosphate ABC transporter substrate-binding protein [Pseudomonadales bacterium]|nr:phosphate ABC transporter substrate-binding protein [Pseudomonadales bacterium]